MRDFEAVFNKGKNDVNMKGHLGTMLFQKCSDVFKVEKINHVFLVTHQVSRHRSCEDFVFKLDENAIPQDATIERQLQVQQMAAEQKEQKREELCSIFEGAEKLTKSEMVKRMSSKLGYKKSQAYRLVNELLDDKILKKSDIKHYRIDFQYLE